MRNITKPEIETEQDKNRAFWQTGRWVYSRQRATVTYLWAKTRRQHKMMDGEGHRRGR